VDSADKDYFEAHILPLLDTPGVEFIGEIGEAEKSEFLGNARALLFPISWPEPFGLVMIEAMACGTPVIAFNQGSVPEIVRNGLTGFIVETVDEAVEAVQWLAKIDRVAVRANFERHFSVEVMAANYEAAYEKVLADRIDIESFDVAIDESFLPESVEVPLAGRELPSLLGGDADSLDLS
jgi:glycosyltransferase involved in cell wall biosynthesis